MSTKTKRIKARVMYCHSDDLTAGVNLYAYDRPKDCDFYTHPVAVLDLSDRDALVEQRAKAIYLCSYSPEAMPKLLRQLRHQPPTWEQLCTESPENVVTRNCREKARATMRADGIPTNTKGRKEL